jgi:S1-C subfamily serine protease
MARPVLDVFPLDASHRVHAADRIFVVGNPFKVAEGDEPLTVMKGVMSGRAKINAARGTQPFPYLGEVLLLDAITSGPGQAGSAVVDLDGNLIGIVGKSVTSNLTNTLLNYAMPVEEIVAFLKDAQTGATAATRPVSVSKGPGYHGISLSRIAFHRELAFVRSVTRGSPADKAGVKADDLIVSANGTAISRGREFTELCDRMSVGEELSLIIKRGEQLIPVRLTLTEAPK